MKLPLWPRGQFLTAIDGRLAGEIDGDITSISIDSRTVRPGAVFFAIRGENFDGHEFAGVALDAGARVAVVGMGFEPGRQIGPIVMVDDPLRAMERLGVAARARSCAAICGITGSVGKTSTKVALGLALGASGATHASPSSFNNHWGVPYSLASLPEVAAYGVFEMGMNHGGEIEPLTAMVRPHVALITNVAPAHIGNFSSVAEIAEAKAEIFSGLEAGGRAVLPADSPHFPLLRQRASESGAQIITFGTENGADVVLRSVAEEAGGSRIEIDIFGRRLAYTLGAPGRHLAINSLGVLAAVHALGADVGAGAACLGAVKAAVGRGQRSVLEIAGGTALLIDESYNANPVSMVAALTMLGAAKPGKGGRRIAVLGDMLELGDDAPRYHLDLADPISASGADMVYLSGPHMSGLADVLRGQIEVRCGQRAVDNQAGLLAEIRAGDVIMIKGSLGSKLGPLVTALRRRYAASAPHSKG